MLDCVNNEVDQEGNNALLIAAKYGKFEILKSLIELNKPNLECVNNDGDNLILIAARHRQFTVIKKFLALNSNSMDNEFANYL